jgi:imidazolonepropionase-like amidohydrolase
LLAPLRLVAQPTQTSLAITHVTVVDPRDGSETPDETVFVRGQRIIAVEHLDSGLWPHATVLDGRGKFLIPGLWDMEVHVSWCGKTALPLLLANGVTAVRDMGGNFGEIEGWKSNIASGVLTGPKIFQVGPMLNGQSFNQYQLATGSPEQARAIVRTLKFLGVSGLEVERRVDKNSYEALLDEGKKDGLPLGGHVPISVSPQEASNDGQATIENIESLYYGTFAKDIQTDSALPAAIDRFLESGDSDRLFGLFAKNSTAVTPVLSALAVILEQPANEANNRYVAHSLLEQASKQPVPQTTLDGLRAEMPEYRKTVAKLQKDGVLILAGTDIAGARVPGFTLHRELEELVSAGLTPLEALRAATINPAIALHLEADYGSVETGKVADMVLLDADPLQNVQNTQRISVVIQNGHLYRRHELDGMLDTAARQAATH